MYAGILTLLSVCVGDIAVLVITVDLSELIWVAAIIFIIQIFGLNLRTTKWILNKNVPRHLIAVKENILS